MSADAVYSATLLIAFLAGIAAIAGAVIGRTATAWSNLGSGSVRSSAFFTWVVLLASVGVHLLFGHPPGSTRALPPFEFVREHLSFIVAAVLPIIAFVIRGRPKRKHE